MYTTYKQGPQHSSAIVRERLVVRDGERAGRLAQGHLARGRCHGHQLHLAALLREGRRLAAPMQAHPRAEAD